MATRVVTFLAPEGPPHEARRYSFEGIEAEPSFTHLPSLLVRLGESTVVCFGSLEARRRWVAHGALARELAGVPVGFREFPSGGSEADRWTSFTALMAALGEGPLAYDQLDGRPGREVAPPTGLLLDLTHASAEQAFLASAVASFLQGQRGRQVGGTPLALRVVRVLDTGKGESPLVELTPLLQVVRWGAAGIDSERGAAAGVRPAEQLRDWSRRARTVPAVPWAQGVSPRALNLTGRDVRSWTDAEREAASVLAMLPVELPQLASELVIESAGTDLDALADRVATHVLDAQPTAAFIDVDLPLALPLVLRLLPAGVRCFAPLRRGGAFVAWRELLPATA